MRHQERSHSTQELTDYYASHGACLTAQLLLDHGISLPLERLISVLEEHNGIPRHGMGSKSFINAWGRYREQNPRKPLK